MENLIKPGDGTQLPPSLADLDKDTPPTPVKTVEEIAAEEARVKAEAEKKAADEKAAAESKAKEEEERAQKEVAEKEKAEAEAAEKRYQELKTKDPKTLTEDEKKELQDFISQLEEDDDPDHFWEKVDQLHGHDPLKVEYGDVDPLSPEGVVMRDKALIERTQQSVFEALKQADPRGYAYLLHRQANGSDEDFFKSPSVTLPDYETFKNNVDLQKQVLTKDLQGKGLSESHTKLIVDQAIKDGKLFEESDRAYKTRQTSEAKAVEEAEKAATAREQAEQKQIQAMSSVIDDIVTNSKTDKIVIPETKRAEFAKALKDSMYFDGTNFFIIKPLTRDNAAEIAQAEYFGYVKGNLKELVERTAATKAASTLRLRSKKTEKTPSTSNNGSADNSRYIPLSDVVGA